MRRMGVSITEEDKKYMKQCIGCGSWAPLASEVCASCGWKEFRDHRASKMRKVCKSCGTSNPEYVKNYCVKCGESL